MVALLTAALLLLARIFRLGFLADFLSRTVLVGFLAGVGVQVSIAMLGDMFGMSVPLPSSRSLAQLAYVAGHLAHVNPPTLALTVLVVVAILGLKRLLPRVPMARWWPSWAALSRARRSTSPLTAFQCLGQSAGACRRCASRPPPGNSFSISCPWRHRVS